MPKFFAREPYCVVFQKNSGSEVDYGFERGYQDLPSKGFLSQNAKNFVGENFRAVFQKISGSDRLYGQERGLSSFSVGSLLYQHPENFGKRTLLSCVSENFW